MKTPDTMQDDIRPRGTVEVQCCKCEWYFWVDCLDPRLPSEPLVCPSCLEPDRKEWPKAED